MRSGVKLAAVMVVAVGVAAASPFYAGYVGPGTPPAEAVASAVSWATDSASSLWTQAFGALPADGSALVDGSSATPGSILQLAQASTPAKPATPAPATGAKPPTTAPATSAPAAAGPAAGAPNLSQSDLAMVVSLLRNTLVALNQANLTGNYTVLRDLGAPGFRDANTATKLSEIFAPIRSRNIDLSSVVLLDPHLTLAKLNENGMLDIVGSLTTQPVGVNFEMLYQGVSNTWQLFGISIAADTGAQAAAPAGSGAPAAPAAAAPAAKPTAVPTPSPRP
jgi:hypothetical protein